MERCNVPTLTIFAGVNGAGKTTLYKYQLAKDYSLKNQFRVNPDEILKDFGADLNEGHIINGHVPVKVKDGESPIHCKRKNSFN